MNTHGIKGEIRVISRTDFPEERYQVDNQLFLFMTEKSSPIQLTIKSHRKHKNFDLLIFEGYEDVNQAESLKGGMLKVPESQLGELPEDEFYFHEILGCLVFTTHGEEIGKVIEILTPGANDVWVVKGENGKENYIPYIEQVVKKVDIKEQIILIDPMEGLLS